MGAIMTGTTTKTDHSQELYIGGKWQPQSGTASIDVLSASTEEVIGAVPAGTAADVDRAVRAARAAFDNGWGQTSVAERADWLRKLANALQQRAAQIANTISQEVGSPISMSTNIQAGLPVMVTNGYAQLIAELKLEQEIGNSLVVREPYGVVGAITPWNYPLHQIMAKVAPALAAGCTVVLKPSEVAPLNALLLAEASLEIGLPAGVLNIVTGYGPEVGEAIASHPLVDMVSFTGSLRAGKRVGALAAEGIKKVTLELGGKSAFVVLDDAPLEKAIPAGARNAMLNSGQTCSAWTRMVVPRSRYAEALELAVQAIASLKVGDPLDPGTRLGPLISSTQRDRVEGYIAKGKQEGARVTLGGGRPAAFGKGYYVEPTVFADVTSKMTIAQEEIFGPVLSILPYDTEEEAIGIANDTIYGLAGGVWSGDPDRAMRVARRMRTGQVDVNGGKYNPLAPFGGYKQSGIGRELGMYGLEEYFQVKSIAR
jgi:aldehyde dehydrogenase (NAD+)